MEEHATELEELGFKIDGKVYPIPTLDSFDMDEGQILWDIAQTTIEDFVPVGDDASEEEIEAHGRELQGRVKNPAFLRALMTVAYRRGNPKLPIGRIRDVISRSNHVQAMTDFLRASATAARAGDPRVPLGPETEQPTSFDGSSVNLSGSSGNGSRQSSDVPDEIPAPTGAMRSDTSLMSVPTGSGE